MRGPRPPKGRPGESAVSAIITRDGELLVVQRCSRPGDPWSSHWALPGGFWKECDEDLFQTAVREVWEEVGIDAKSFRLVGWLTPKTPRSRPDIVVHPAVFLAAEKPPVCLSEELVDYRWVPLSGLEAARRVLNTERGELETDVFLWEDIVIWGLTYLIVRELRQLSGSELGLQ